MDTYSPDEAPDPREWLSLDEAERLLLVAAYHDREKIHVANARLHAAIHTVVENQLAIPEKVVVDTMDRLQREGLSRHDAIHAVGSVLVERLVAALKQKTTPVDLAGAYLADLKGLTAEAWKNS
jgi:DNA primase catalytic subunit